MTSERLYELMSLVWFLVSYKTWLNNQGNILLVNSVLRHFKSIKSVAPQFILDERKN